MRFAAIPNAASICLRDRARFHVFGNARPTLYRNAPLEHAGNGGKNLKSGKKLSVHPT